MKLTKKEINLIIKETEDIQIRVIERYLERIYWEAIMESEHGDWGDRD